MTWKNQIGKIARETAMEFLHGLLKKPILKIWKKSWAPFGSYLLNSTANPAHFHQNWAGLAVLFSRQILKRLPGFFLLFNILIFIYVSKYENIETHARAFMTLNILTISRVSRHFRLTLWRVTNAFGFLVVILQSRISWIMQDATQWDSMISDGAFLILKNTED